MTKVGLHIKDGKITTDDGKEMVLVYVDVLERLQEQLKEANNIIKQYCFYEYGRPYIEKWGVK